MGVLDDTEVFAAVVVQGGFSHAAKHLGLSNGLISRRIAQLEAKLGVTLIKRTTRQLQLTPEGELFWRHAQRIQQEMNSALSLIQSRADKPHGDIRISAPLHFGRQHLMPIITKFMQAFPDINIDLILTNQQVDPIKDNIDLILRGAGYRNSAMLKDSSMKMKLLVKQKIYLYASTEYLLQRGEPQKPEDLANHLIVGFADLIHTDKVTWSYLCKGKKSEVYLKTKFNSTDVDTSLTACLAGFGIGKFAELIAKEPLKQQKLRQVLPKYDWGDLHVYAVYTQQQALPKRTRLLLEFIASELQTTCEKVKCQELQSVLPLISE